MIQASLPSSEAQASPWWKTEFTRTQLLGRTARCLTDLSGGGAIRGHNRVSRWLAKWLQQGRAPGKVLLEQQLYQEQGVMDITVAQNPSAAWIDVARVSPSSSSVRTVRQRARTDGAAARDEEKVKKRRYGDRVDPFVIEVGGRPGNPHEQSSCGMPTRTPSCRLSWAWLGRPFQPLSRQRQAAMHSKRGADNEPLKRV